VFSEESIAFYEVLAQPAKNVHITSLHYTPNQPNMLNLFIDPDVAIDGTA